MAKRKGKKPKQWNAKKKSHMLSKREKSKIDRLDFKCNVTSTYAVGGSIAATTGTAILLSAIAQGSAYNQRTGNSVQVRKLRGHIDLFYEAAQAANINTRCYVRAIICQGIRMTGTAPSLAELLEDNTTPFSAVMSGYNTDWVAVAGVDSRNKGKTYRILYDSGPHLIYNPLYATANYQTGQPVNSRSKLYIDGKKFKQLDYYDATSTHPTNSGTVYLVLFTDIAAGTQPLYNYAFNLWFDNVV